jgi:murein DD-endopeptidase MepM/ murein hydrolase activator NlpD
MTATLMLLLLHTAGAQEPWGRPCGTVYNPLVTSDRRGMVQLEALVSSGFGDGRSSYRPGHLHAGIDLRTEPGQAIHAICPGRVVDIHLSFPHQTVVVEHHTPTGEVFWSSYKHVEDLKVAVGDDVEEITTLARSFEPEEQARAGWRSNHLHFEIRSSIEDDGTASFTSMTMEELTHYATDPLVFFREHLD